MDRRELARRIEHTLLAPDARADDVRRLCDEAREWGVHAVCVAPARVALAARRLGSCGVGVVSVAGFPHGDTLPGVKAAEAAAVLDAGAVEVDMVMAIGVFKDGDDRAVVADIAAVAEAVHGAPGRLLKVILETALLSPDEIARACRLAVDAGADFVKTSTGFARAGASVEAVARMRASVPPQIGVKAAGGIRDYATAMQMVAAGATRIGASATRDILRGAPD